MEKRVLVIQDASNEVNYKVFDWAINGLSLIAGDKLTLLSVLHQFITPLGYKSSVDLRSLVGTNQRTIETEAARIKEEYLNNDELARIVKQYEAQEVEFKIELVAGSSLREVALKAAIKLKATWVVLDRQMKQDEQYFLQMLSCGISRLKRHNMIVHLGGPLDLPVEILCNSHETYDETENQDDDPTFSIEVFRKSQRIGFEQREEQQQTQSSPHEGEGCSTLPCDSNQTTVQTNPDHLSTDERDIKNSNQKTCQIKIDQHCQDQEQKQRRSHEGERDTTVVINNNQTAQKISGEPSQDEEKTHKFFRDETWGSRHPTNSKRMIDQTADDMLSQNQEHIQNISRRDLLDGQQEKNILESSRCSICPVCKNKRPDIEWQKDFSYNELQTATDGFSEKNRLSAGGHGSTFKGQLEGELKVVVKQHEITNCQVGEQIKSEVKSVLKARHKNVVILLGSIREDNRLLTVHEYACNGSLENYLSKQSCKPFPWRERMKVAIGVCRGLKYLHDNNIIHGNIKASNILLTHDFKPLLGDFGFAKTLELKKSYRSKNMWNSGYTAPDYQEKGKLSTKTDVYSFGVVILELITGLRATDKIAAGKSLVEWAKPLLGGKKFTQLVDPKIGSSYEEDHVPWLVQVTEQCLKKNPKDRLTMNMVASALQGIADSEQRDMTEDSSPAISDSRYCVPDKNDLQGQTRADQPTQKQEQIESSSYGEERILRLKFENNYMLYQREVDQMSQVEEQTRSRLKGEMSSEKRIINSHTMDQTLVDPRSETEEEMNSTLSGISRKKISNNHVIGQKQDDQLSQDQEEENCFIRNKIGLRPMPVSEMTCQAEMDQLIRDKKQLQSSSYENPLDGNQVEIILENSKSSVCSICKTKRPNIAWQKDFTYVELQAATDGFSIQNSLSECGDGPAFKGLIDNKLKIFVKKYQITRLQEEKIFKSEVQLLTKAMHKNVIMLLGLCTDKSHLMIVYEKACNGSLDQYLSGGNCQPLIWKQRVKVAIGVARGLKYLHENSIIHGNIKPSNILLTHDFEPLLGDFGFGKAKLESKKSYKDKNVGNSGYTAPEYLENGKLSIKTDVYSFGVVILELITGRRATDKLSGGKSLVGWARPLLRGKNYSQLVDPKIRDSYEEEQILWLVQVTEQCLRKNPKERLTMNMVLSALQGISDTDEYRVIEDCSPEKSYLQCSEPAMTSSQGNSEKLQQERTTYVACSVSDATQSEDDEESLIEEDLGSEVGEEREDDITLSISNGAREISQESDNCIACVESKKETQEKERLSTEEYQISETCIAYGGARNFFLGGAEEYIVCEQFFNLCNSI